MKKKYLVLEVREQTVLSSAWLSSDGVKTEDVSGSVIGIYVQEFDDEILALWQIKVLTDKHSDRKYSIIPLYVNSEK